MNAACKALARSHGMLEDPGLHQRGYMASLQHRFAIGSDALLMSQFTYKKFDADVTPNSTEPMRLLV